MTIQKVVFAVSILLLTGCATLQSTIPDMFKSDEQVQLDKAKGKLAEAQNDQKIKADHLKGVPVPDIETRKSEVTIYRRAMLDQRRTYVQELIAEYKTREAELKKKAARAGYFALGTKSVAIASGIASAILVAASSANAAIVAGLIALSTGTVAFQDTAEGVGYSTVISEGQLEALKGVVNTAYLKFQDVIWEYLYSYAGYAEQKDWDAEMKKLGSAIVGLEAAIRYTKYEIKVIKVTATGS